MTQQMNDFFVHALADLALILNIIPSLIQLIWFCLTRRTSGNRINTWKKTVNRFPNKECIVFQNKSWSFSQVDSQSNDISRLLLSDFNLKEKQVVAVVMQNSADFLVIFLAIVKIGCIPALLNYNVKPDSLAELIKSCDPVLVILDSDVNLTLKLPSVTADVLTNGKSDSESLIRSSATALDTFCYIFTSGTTGLAKAVKVTHAKAHAATMVTGAFGQVFLLCRINSFDRIYTCLPLYHSSALLVSFGMTMSKGSCLVLSKKFSATKFWEEVIEQKVTIVRFILSKLVISVKLRGISSMLIPSKILNASNSILESE